MKLLVDTVAYLWAADASPRLSTPAAEAVANRTNILLFSVASAWEISIKAALGKLKIAANFEELLARFGATLLPISLEHTAAVRTLPLHHRDPFDRMLIAQARSEQAVVVTSDPVFARYGVAVLW